MKWLFPFVLSLCLFSSFAWANSENEFLAKKLVLETSRDILKDAQGTFEKIKSGNLPYKNGELYVFVYDLSLNMVAHYDKKLIGVNLKGKADVCGCLFRDEIYNRVTNSVGDTNCRSSDKDFVFYVYKNPKTGKLEHKKAFFKLTKIPDGRTYIVVSGVYLKELRECEK